MRKTAAEMINVHFLKKKMILYAQLCTLDNYLDNDLNPIYIIHEINMNGKWTSTNFGLKSNENTLIKWTNLDVAKYTWYAEIITNLFLTCRTKVI